ncbi:KUP/HAK/KT family potassium transporter [Coxiella burnetii]|uniref:KUP/HAK/KT family potassium transporter n=2 Tax=Coxiella burnetii TaxID=777 RepID=UPI000693A28F|nr:KUP/HAK/KT family potassium transporter [Coxiella burnetii]
MACKFNLFNFLCFFGIDVLFLGANIQKVSTGGWIPIAFALLCAFIMYTWNKGMNYVRDAC